MIYAVFVRQVENSNEAHYEDRNWENNLSNHDGEVLDMRHDTQVGSGGVFVYRDHKEAKEEKTALDYDHPANG